MLAMWRGVELSGAFSGRPVAEHEEYRRVRRETPDAPCPFCEPEPAYLVSSTAHLHLVINKYPYVIWDSQLVEEHLMVVPKAHRESMSSLSPEEYGELSEVLREYEPAGYSIYTRAATNQGRSQAHFHTHLIKTSEAVATTAMPTLAAVADQADHLVEAPHTNVA